MHTSAFDPKRSIKGAGYLLALLERYCFLHLKLQRKVCSVQKHAAVRRKKRKNSRKSTDFGAHQAYQKIGQLWREMAQRAERNKR